MSNKTGAKFEDSMQHVEFMPNMIVHYTRCESCMYGSHVEEPTWHSWAGMDDMRDDDTEWNERVKKQKCHCDCAGPLDPHEIPAVLGDTEKETEALS